MLFTDYIRKSREQLQLPQRKLAEALDIDTATYLKIEKGERRAKKEQVVTIAQVLNVEEKELLSLWPADKIIEVIADEEKLASKTLEFVIETLKNNQFHE